MSTFHLRPQRNTKPMHQFLSAYITTHCCSQTHKHTHILRTCNASFAELFVLIDKHIYLLCLTVTFLCKNMTFSPRLVHNIKVNSDAVTTRRGNADIWSTRENSYWPFSDLCINCVKCIDFNSVVVVTTHKKINKRIRNFKLTSACVHTYVRVYA